MAFCWWSPQGSSWRFWQQHPLQGWKSMFLVSPRSAWDSVPGIISARSLSLLQGSEHFSLCSNWHFKMIYFYVHVCLCVCVSMCLCVFMACICGCCVQGIWFSWGRQLQAIVRHLLWVLGTEFMSPGRIPCMFNCWSTFQGPCLIFLIREVWLIFYLCLHTDLL